MKNLKYTLFFIVLSARLFAQHEMMLWDSIYATPYEEKLHDVKLLTNGDKLVAVGEANVNGNRQGVFYVVNTRNGQLLHREYYGGIGNDALLSVAQASDGTYYLVGYTGAGNGKDCWIIRLDQKYKKMDRIDYYGFGQGELKSIVWDKARNRGVVLGEDKGQNEGYLRLWEINAKGDIMPRGECGHGMVKTLEGMFLAPDGKIWAYGETRKSDISERYDLWYLEVGTDNVFRYHTSSTEVIKAGCSNYNHTLFFSGTKSDDFGWVAECSTSEDGHRGGRPCTAEKSYDKISRKAETMVALASSPSDNIFGIWQKEDGLHLVELLPNLEIICAEQDIKDTDFFKTNNLIRLPNDRLLVVGTETGLGKSKLRILITKINVLHCGKSNQQKPDSNGYRLIFKPVFEDSDGDDILRIDEFGSIKVTITNIGNKTFWDGSYEIIQLDGHDVIELTQDKNGTILPIKPGENTVETIGIRSISQATDKHANLLFIVNGPKRDTCKIAVKPRPSVSFMGSSYTFNAPTQIKDRDSRDVALDSKEIFVEVEIRTPNPNLNDNHLQLRWDGLEISTNKEQPVLSPPKVREGGLYDYTFKFKLQGISRTPKTFTIYNKVDGFTSDPIQIRYTGNKPNLHIIAIGPSYGNLKFTAKDARDFTGAMYRQIETGFFGNIYVDTLIGTEVTANEIRKLLREVYNRNQSSYKGNKVRLRSNDYLVFFYSGHGLKINDKFWLEPVGYDEQDRLETAISYQYIINDVLAPLECKTFLFIDACLSGAAGKGNRELASLVQRVNEQAPGITSFSSCSDNESSWESVERNSQGQKIATRGNGVFTKALLEAFNLQEIRLDSGKRLGIHLTQEQDDEGIHQFISIGALDKFLTTRVPDILVQDPDLSNLQQHPKTTIQEQNPDLPFYIIKY